MIKYANATTAKVGVRRARRGGGRGRRRRRRRRADRRRHRPARPQRPPGGARGRARRLARSARARGWPLIPTRAGARSGRLAILLLLLLLAAGRLRRDRAVREADSCSPGEGTERGRPSPGDARAGARLRLARERGSRSSATARRPTRSGRSSNGARRRGAPDGRRGLLPRARHLLGRAHAAADRRGDRGAARRARRLAARRPRRRPAIAAVRRHPGRLDQLGQRPLPSLGILVHVGQPESRAGFEAGGRMAAAGVRNAICINHAGQQGAGDPLRGVRPRDAQAWRPVTRVRARRRGPQHRGAEARSG